MKKLKTVFLVLTKGCNLECEYCYEKEFNNNIKLMSLDTFRKILSKFDEVINLDLFGGEPLLNRIIINFVIDNFEYLNINKLTISTNGILLDNKIISFYQKFLGRINIIVSIDSDKSSHDNHRVDKLGRGTYDLVIKNILNIKNKEYIQINCCITPYSSDKFYYGIINLFKLGFNKFKIIIIYELSWNNTEIIKLVNNFKKLKLFKIKRNINIPFLNNIYLENTNDCKNDMLSKYRFNYDGTLIPCTLYLSNFKKNIYLKTPNIHDYDFNLGVRKNIILYFFSKNKKYNNETICDYYSDSVYRNNKNKIITILRKQI